MFFAHVFSISYQQSLMNKKCKLLGRRRDAKKAQVRDLLMPHYFGNDAYYFRYQSWLLMGLGLMRRTNRHSTSPSIE